MTSLPIPAAPVHSDDATQIAIEMAEQLDALADAHPKARDYYLAMAERARAQAATMRGHADQGAALRAQNARLAERLDDVAERLVQEPDDEAQAMVREIAELKQRHQAADDEARARRRIEVTALRREWRRVRRIGERALRRARPTRVIERHHQHQRAGRARRRLVRASAAGGGGGDGDGPAGPSDLLIVGEVRP